MTKYGLIALAIASLGTGLLLAGAVTPAGKEAFARMTIDVGIVASDLEESAKFYKEALGFTEVPGFDVSKEMGGDSGLVDYQAFKVRVFVLADESTAT